MDLTDSTLLVIDDEETVRNSIVAYLEDSGYNVEQACHGEQGLDMFHQLQPDLILCDLRMPKMDGLVVLEKVMQENPALPFIVVSGAGVMNDVVKAFKLGASDYVVKPIVDLTVLEMSVKRNLERALLVKQNKQYRDELESNNIELKEHIDRLQLDMQAGRLVQQKMLPHSRVIKDPLVFEHYMLPSMYLSGDFVDYFELQDGLFFFYIMDVSGHGASSAMITVLVKSVINRFVENSLSELAIQPEFDLQSLLNTINLELLKSETGKHATMFVCTIDLYQNTLQYINAAHYPRPILRNFNCYTEIDTEGLALGLFDDAQYTSKSIDVDDDFELTMCSDGLFEVLPGKKLQQKEQVLLEIIQKQHNTIDELAHELSLPCKDEVPDDVTLLRVKKVK